MKQIFVLGAVLLAFLFTSKVYSDDNLSDKIKMAYDAFNKAQYEKLSEYIDENMVEHSPSPGQKPGLSGLIDAFKEMRTGFPDINFTIDDIIVDKDGNKAAVLFTMTGTNSGSMMGMPATNKAVKIQGIDYLYFKNNKATEHWGYIDESKMMQQLGLTK